MSKSRFSAILFFLAALAFVPAGAAFAEKEVKPQLPGGASSLQENYGDWRVLCAVNDKTKQCAMQQQRNDVKSGQLVLAIVLTPSENGGATGSLLMPFGLELASGVSLSLDSGAAGKPLAFKTCMPQGCVVPLVLDTNTMTNLKSGKELKLTVRAADAPADKPTVLSVSLNGFGPALERTITLLK